MVMLECDPLITHQRCRAKRRSSPHHLTSLTGWWGATEFIRVLRTLGETKLTLERGSKSTKSPREALLWISRHLELNSSVQKIAHFLPDFNADLCSKRAQFESAQSGRVHNDPLFGLITMVIWFQK